MISRLQFRFFRQINIGYQCFSSHINFENFSELNNEGPSILDDDVPQLFSKVESENHQNQNFTVDEKGFVTVFTDGACSFNGNEEKARAGIGVWFGEDHPLNVSESISGRSTCNVAEIKAATKALTTAKEVGIKKLKIMTDSQFLISCATSWIPKWKTNGWRGATKKPVVNKEELMQLDENLSSIEVSWVHVPSHSGIRGNEMANNLAKHGIYQDEE